MKEDGDIALEEIRNHANSLRNIAYVYCNDLDDIGYEWLLLCAHELDVFGGRLAEMRSREKK